MKKKTYEQLIETAMKTLIEIINSPLRLIEGVWYVNHYNCSECGERVLLAYKSFEHAYEAYKDEDGFYFFTTICDSCAWRDYQKTKLEHGEECHCGGYILPMYDEHPNWITFCNRCDARFENVDFNPIPQPV